MASYKYDYKGRRVSKTVYGSPDAITKYLYDGAQVIAEYEYDYVLGRFKWARNYFYGPGIDEPIMMIDYTAGNKMYYYHFDGLGSGDRWNGTGSSKQMGIGPNNPIGDKVLSDQNKTGTGAIGPARKMPLDARIVGWAVAVPAFVFLLLGLLLVIGLADIPTPDTRPALFGTVSLDLEVQFGIYWFSIGLAGLFSAYGVRKGHKFGWWCLLILLIDGIFNDMVMLPRFKVSILTTTGISIVIIAWLIWRRRLYNIGGTS